MPRIRSLKPECWQDEALGTVSRDARLLFVGLITQADDAGRLKAAPTLLRSLIFPYDDQLEPGDIEGWLAELSGVGLVIRYAHGGNPYAALKNWASHQKINRPQASRNPAPPRQKRSRNVHGTLTDDSSPEGIGGDQGSGEDQGGESGLTPERSPLSFLLVELIEGNGSKPPTVTKAWADAERLMLDRDKRPHLEAEALIRWCQRDEFWRSNVLSMTKFRAKYDQLRLQKATQNGHDPRKEAPSERPKRFTHIRNA